MTIIASSSSKVDILNAALEALEGTPHEDMTSESLSGFKTIDGQDYLVMRDINGIIIVVYKVDGQRLKRLDRSEWPEL